MDTFLHCPNEVSEKIGFVLQKFTLHRTQLLPPTKWGKSPAHEGKQQKDVRCQEGMWNAWVIKQTLRTFHQLDKRRHLDGLCSSSPDQPSSSTQLLRKPRMWKLHHLRRFSSGNLEMFCSFWHSQDYRASGTSAWRGVQCSEFWMIYSPDDSVLEEKTKMSGTPMQLRVAFLLYLGWHPGTEGCSTSYPQATPHPHLLQFTSDPNRHQSPPDSERRLWQVLWGLCGRQEEGQIQWSRAVMEDLHGQELQPPSAPVGCATITTGLPSQVNAQPPRPQSPANQTDLLSGRWGWRGGSYFFVVVE